MATRKDIQDIIGLPAGGDAPAPKKRAKPAAPTKKLQGVTREVAALYGERPPPVAVYEEKKLYRAKRTNFGKVRPWIQQPFTNPARRDDLVLKHWRRKPTARPNIENGEDTAMEEEENPSPPLETNYEFARFNVEVTVPTYTDEEYDAHLQNESWSREETDYLFEMAKEYFMRWAVIYDRYDFQPTKTEPPDDSSGGDNPTDALATLPYNSSSQRERTERSVEDLKARYYSVWETTLKLHRPPEAMESTEFELLEVLHRYNPDSEAARKRLALALMARTLDEVKEEEFLLAELQRINIAATRLDAERAELRERLEAPQPQRELPSGALANFQSSQALSALFAQLFQQDRSKKRASGSGRLSLSAGDIIGTPTAAQHAALAAAAGTRKASIAHGHSQPQQPQLRPMTAAEERRFGSSTHERLTSGISFGSDKLLKMRQAKSGVQTAKIGGILTELGFGEVITIPTARVGATFEGLVAKVSKLLDARKVREKEEAEAKVLEGMKARLKGENPAATNGESATNGRQSTETQERDMKQEDRDESMVDQSVADFAAVNASADDDGENDNDAEGEEDDADADGDEDADGETNATSTRQVSEAISTRAANTPAASVKAGQKRSASVLSETSNKSAKRTRK